MLDNTRIAEIEERLRKATKGPWEAHGRAGSLLKCGVTARGPYKPHIGALCRIAWIGSVSPARPTNDKDLANAQLIAHAPTDLRALIDERKTLVAEIRREERERCAKIAREIPWPHDIGDISRGHWNDAAESIARAIEASNE